MKLKLTGFFLLLFASYFTGFSQKVTNKGKEFYISFFRAGGAFGTESIVLLTSTVNTTGLISNPNSSFTQPFTITAGIVTQVFIPYAEAVNVNSGINNLGLVVTAADSIAVYALSNVIHSSDATTVIPKPALGTEYLIAGYNNTYATFPSCFLIEATEDNTTLEITPSVHSNGHVAGVPFSITLNKGQTYYVKADNIGNNTEDDVSGSFVSVTNGCKPIAVFSGVEAAQVPIGFESGDILYEQLFPISSFGKQFITSTIRGRNMYVGRVYAAYDSTKVFIDGVLFATLNKGKVYEFISPQNLPKYIATSKPAEVMMFAPSQSFDAIYGPVNQGDPSMMTIPPLEQQLKQSVFLSPQMGAITAHKVSIVCKTVDAFNTVLDGANAGSSFAAVTGNPLYSYAAFDISAGQHTITNNRGFVSYAYGFGNSQGYGYCTGSSVENISTYFTCNQIPSITHPIIDVCTGVDTFKIITSDSNTNYKWDFGDGTIINTGGTVLVQTHNYAIAGTYLVTLVSTRGSVNNACSSLNTDTSFLTVKVSASLIPSVTIASAPVNPVCQGSTNINFIATPVNEGVAPVYQWKKNGAVVGGNTQILTLPTVAANDQIICNVTSSITCALIPTAADTIVIQLTLPTAPSVNIATGSDTLCENTLVNFTSTLGSNYQNVIYQWRRNGNNIGTNQNTFSILPNNGDTITCLITVNSYCTSPDTAISNAKVITVLPATNVAEVQISTSQNPVCANTAAIFTAIPVLGGTNPAYQWVLNGINVGTNSNTYTIPAMQNGDVVYCIMTSSSPVVCNRIANSNTITMQVNTAVTPAVSITASRNNICTGDIVAFTAVPVNGGSAPIYQWKLNGVNVGTNSNTYSTTALNNNDIVLCSMISNALCLATPAPAVSNSITMTVSTNAAPAISISASQTNICQGNAVSFTAIPINSNATTTYQWKINSNNAGTNTVSFTSSVLQNNDTVYCIMTTISACAANPVVQSNKIIMQVNPVVTPSITIATAKTTICQGDMVNCTAAPVNAGATPTYQWKLNGVNVGTNAVTYSSASLADNDVITCSMLTSLPCATVAGAVGSNSITMTVSPIVSPTISISASKNPICKGDNATITATVTNGGTAPVYKWMINGNIASNNSSYSSVNFADGDKISCSLTSSFTCALPASSSDIIMKVNPVPTVSFNPAEVILPYGNTYQMQPVTNGAITSYLWTPGTFLSNNKIPKPIVNTPQNQIYSLTVTNASDCRANAAISIVVFKDFRMPNSFMPAGKNKQFIIPRLYQSLKIHYFKIFNRYGQMIFETTDVAKGWDGTINGQAQPVGAYVWIIEYEHPITKKTILAKGSAMLIR